MVGVQGLENRVDMGIFNRVKNALSHAWNYLGHDYHLTMVRMHDRFASTRYKLAGYATGGSLAVAGIGCGVAGGGSSGKEDYDAHKPDAGQTTPYDAAPFQDTAPVSSGTPDAGGKDTYVPPKEDVSAPPIDTGYDTGKDDDKGGSTDTPDVPVPKDEGSDLEQKVCLDGDGDGRPPTSAKPAERLACAFPDVDDCDDEDPEVYPGQKEVKGNGKDDDCNPLTKDTYTLTVQVLHGLGTGPVKGIALLVKNADKQAECTTTDDNGDATCELPSTSGFNLETGITSKFYQTVRSADEVQSAVEGDVVMTLWLIEKHTLPIGSPYKDFWDYMTDVTETKPKVPIYNDDGTIFDVIDNPKTFPNYLATTMKVFVPKQYVIDGVTKTVSNDNYVAMKAGVQDWIDTLNKHNSNMVLLELTANEGDANVVIVPYNGNSWTNTNDDGEKTSGATIYFNSGTFSSGSKSVQGETAHELAHVFGLNHGQDPNDITDSGTGSGKVSNIAACAALYANTIKGQQQTKHIKYDFPVVK